MYSTLHRGIDLATEMWRGKEAGQVHTGRLEQSWDLTQMSESSRGPQHPCPWFPPTGSWLSLGTSPPCPILAWWFERIQFQMSLDLIKPISLSHFPATMMCARTSPWPHLDTPGLVGELPEETLFCGVVWEEVRSRTSVAVLLQGEETCNCRGPSVGLKMNLTARRMYKRARDGSVSQWESASSLAPPGSCELTLSLYSLSIWGFAFILICIFKIIEIV